METYLLLILLGIFVVLVLLQRSYESFVSCFGRTHNFCLSDIGCEWNSYYNHCQPRTYNSSYYYTWPWGRVPYQWYGNPWWRGPWRRRRWRRRRHW